MRYTFTLSIKGKAQNLTEKMVGKMSFVCLFQKNMRYTPSLSIREIG